MSPPTAAARPVATSRLGREIKAAKGELLTEELEETAIAGGHEP